MDDSSLNTTPSKAAKLGMYAVSLVFWLLIGGSISWLPMLSYGIDRLAGEFALYNCVVLWCGFPLTGGVFIFCRNSLTTVLFAINILCWLSLAGWVWHILLQQ